jgi:hypothetical protein
MTLAPKQRRFIAAENQSCSIPACSRAAEVVNQVPVPSGGVGFYPYCMQHVLDGTFVFQSRQEACDLAEILLRCAGIVWSFEAVREGSVQRSLVVGETQVQGIHVVVEFRAEGEDAILFAAPLFTPAGARPADVLDALASIDYSQYEEYTYETFLAESGLDDDATNAPERYAVALEYHQRGEAFIEMVQQRLGNDIDFLTFVEGAVNQWA